MASDKFFNGYALLIGVGPVGYEETMNDAKKIGAILTKSDNSISFPKNFVSYDSNQVLVLTRNTLVEIRLNNKRTILNGATKSGIILGFEWLIEQSRRNPEATVIIYFAGHGRTSSYSKTKDIQEFYLEPFDFDINNISTYFLQSELVRQIKKVIAKKLIVFMGSCHSAAFVKGLGSEDKEKIGNRLQKSYLAQAAMVEALDQGTGKVILSACHGTEEAFIRPDGEYSVFGQALIEALCGKGTPVTDPMIDIFQVVSYVIKQVPKKLEDKIVTQQPILNKIEYLTEGINILPNVQFQKERLKFIDISSIISSLEKDKQEKLVNQLNIESDKLKNTETSLINIEERTTYIETKNKVNQLTRKQITVRTINEELIDMEKSGLESLLKLLLEKQSFIMKAKVLETNAVVKFQYEHQLKEIKEQIKDIRSQLNTL